eukprot:m.48259 g.48259  ORF g.48259 m.48259 type:complete len:571 (+) comp6975_c0_seq2:487-2199(+)
MDVVALVPTLPTAAMRSREGAHIRVARSCVGSDLVSSTVTAPTHRLSTTVRQRMVYRDPAATTRALQPHCRQPPRHRHDRHARHVTMSLCIAVVVLCAVACVQGSSLRAEGESGVPGNVTMDAAFSSGDGTNGSMSPFKRWRGSIASALLFVFCTMAVYNLSNFASGFTARQRRSTLIANMKKLSGGNGPSHPTAGRKVARIHMHSRERKALKTSDERFTSHCLLRRLEEGNEYDGDTSPCGMRHGRESGEQPSETSSQGSSSCSSTVATTMAVRPCTTRISLVERDLPAWRRQGPALAAQLCAEMWGREAVDDVEASPLKRRTWGKLPLPSQSPQPRVSRGVRKMIQRDLQDMRDIERYGRHRKEKHFANALGQRMDEDDDDRQRPLQVLSPVDVPLSEEEEEGGYTGYDVPRRISLPKLDIESEAEQAGQRKSTLRRSSVRRSSAAGRRKTVTFSQANVAQFSAFASAVRERERRLSAPSEVPQHRPIDDDSDDDESVGDADPGRFDFMNRPSLLDWDLSEPADEDEGNDVDGQAMSFRTIVNLAKRANIKQCLARNGANATVKISYV